MKYKNWLDLWLNNYVKKFAKTNTYYTYYNEVKNHVIPILGLEEVEQIQEVEIQNLISKLIQEGNKTTKLPLSNSHINLIVSIIIRSINKYNDDNNIEKKKFFLNKPKVDNLKIKALSIKNEEKIVNYILENKKEKYYGFIICIFTGIRLGELLALTWNDIDFENKYMNISKTRIKNIPNTGNNICINDPKTYSSIRRIPLTSFLIPIMRIMKMKSDSNFVISYKGKPKCIRSYQKSFSRLLEKLNIKGYTFHSTRHTFATRLLENKVNPKLVSELLGHSNPLTTLKIYSSCFLEEKRKNMEQLTKKYKQKRIT